MWEIAALSVLAGGVAAWRSLGRLRLRFWRDAAESCGLHVEEVSSYAARRLKIEARVGPMEVRIEDGKGYPARVAVAGPPGFSGVRIRRELHEASGSREIEVGDEVFDSTFFVEGPTRLLCALLDEETRRLLVSVNAESRLEIAGGELRAEMFDKQLPSLLPLLLDIAKRFAQQVDVAQRLAANAHGDPIAGVRLQNLLLLVHGFAEDPRTDQELRTACSDSSPQVRLRAAMALGAEGSNILLELAESMVDDICAAQAVSRLGRELPFERTQAILVSALRRHRIQTARACLEALGRSGAAAAVDVLAKVMSHGQGELAVAAAEALELTRSPAAEPSLIAALLHEPSDLQVAAAKALGRVGSVAAVLPLKEATERFDWEVGRAARQAIAEIQSRLPGASPGQLSLSGAEVGQLSLAQGEAGQLSLATDEAGQLSLSPREAGQLPLSGDEE